MKKTIAVLLILVLILAYFSVDVLGAGPDPGREIGDPVPVEPIPTVDDDEDPQPVGEDPSDDEIPDPGSGDTEPAEPVDEEEPAEPVDEEEPAEPGDDDDGDPGEQEPAEEEKDPLPETGGTWTDYVSKKYADDPIPAEEYLKDEEAGTVRIQSEDALAWWAFRVNSGESFAGYSVTLERSLDMSAHLWVPIQAAAAFDGGTFEGSGNAISGLVIPGGDQVGFFGILGGANGVRIRNVRFASPIVNGTGSQVGAVAGFSAVSGDGLILANVIVSDGTITGVSKVGGLVGEGGKLTLDSCSVSVKISAAFFAAGLVGLENGSGTLEYKDCTASASWKKAESATYVCYHGTAEYDGAGEKLDAARTIENVFYLTSEDDHAVYYSAWATHYNDGSRFMNKKADESIEAVFAGASHDFAPHTGLTDWAVASQPEEGTPGVLERHCNIEICNEREEEYFWYVNLHKNNGQEDELVTHIFTVKDVPTAFARPADPLRDSYNLVGWYQDEACTVLYTFTEPVESNLDLYARWEKKQGSLTINRPCAQENQFFLVQVTGEGIDMTVAVRGNDSTTITCLPIGSYTIRELSFWSWRIPDAGSQKLELKEGANFATLVNDAKGPGNYNWLSGESWNK